MGKGTDGLARDEGWIERPGSRDESIGNWSRLDRVEPPHTQKQKPESASNIDLSGNPSLKLNPMDPQNPKDPSKPKNNYDDETMLVDTATDSRRQMKPNDRRGHVHYFYPMHRLAPCTICSPSSQLGPSAVVSTGSRCIVGRQ